MSFTFQTIELYHDPNQGKDIINYNFNLLQNITGGTGNDNYWTSDSSQGSIIANNGTSNDAEGIFSIVLNEANTAIGRASFVANKGNVTVGDYSSSFGQGNEVGGEHSFITGFENSLGGKRSAIIGGSNIIGTADDTVYVPYLNIQKISSGTPISNLGIDSFGNVVNGNSSSGGTTDLVIQKKVINISSNSEIGTNIIPSGYIIYAIVINETSGIDSAGNISIGSTPLGTDVVNSEVVGLGSTIKPSLGIDFFSITSSQSLYISSSLWGNGVVTVYMLLHKILS